MKSKSINCILLGIIALVIVYYLYYKKKEMGVEGAGKGGDDPNYKYTIGLNGAIHDSLNSVTKPYGGKRYRGYGWQKIKIPKLKGGTTILGCRNLGINVSDDQVTQFEIVPGLAGQNTVSIRVYTGPKRTPKPEYVIVGDFTRTSYWVAHGSTTYPLIVKTYTDTSDYKKRASFYRKNVPLWETYINRNTNFKSLVNPKEWWQYIPYKYPAYRVCSFWVWYPEVVSNNTSTGYKKNNTMWTWSSWNYYYYWWSWRNNNYASYWNRPMCFGVNAVPQNASYGCNYWWGYWWWNRSYWCNNNKMMGPSWGNYWWYATFKDPLGLAKSAHKPIADCAKQRGGKCTTCSPRFTLGKDKASCSPNPVKNCKAQKKAVCTTCNKGYTIKGKYSCTASPITNCLDQAETKCLKCKENWVLDKGKCSADPVKNCKVQKGISCKKCNTGYTLKDNKCNPTPIKNCKTQKITKCIQCKQNFKLKDNQCEPYPKIENCAKQIDDKCQKCIKGYSIKDRWGRMYSKCVKTRYGKIDNCKTQEEDKCVECDMKFDLTNGRCYPIPIIRNCLEQKGKICTQCNPEYNLRHNQCISKKYELEALKKRLPKLCPQLKEVASSRSSKMGGKVATCPLWECNPGCVKGRGRCVRGVCVCNTGWMGTQCEQAIKPLCPRRPLPRGTNYRLIDDKGRRLQKKKFHTYNNTVTKSVPVLRKIRANIRKIIPLYNAPKGDCKSNQTCPAPGSMSTEELKRWAARLKEAREKKRCTPEECPVIYKEPGKEIKVDNILKMKAKKLGREIKIKKPKWQKGKFRQLKDTYLYRNAAKKESFTGTIPRKLINNKLNERLFFFDTKKREGHKGFTHHNIKYHKSGESAAGPKPKKFKSYQEAEEYCMANKDTCSGFYYNDKEKPGYYYMSSIVHPITNYEPKPKGYGTGRGKRSSKGWKSHILDRKKTPGYAGFVRRRYLCSEKEMSGGTGKPYKMNINPKTSKTCKTCVTACRKFKDCKGTICRKKGSTNQCLYFRRPCDKKPRGGKKLDHSFPSGYEECKNDKDTKYSQCNYDRKGARWKNPPKCPKGWKQVGELGADVPGCGLESCSARYGRQANSPESCSDHCKKNKKCHGFSYAPMDGDKNHKGKSVCTIYKQNRPTTKWKAVDGQYKQIFCKNPNPSVPCKGKVGGWIDNHLGSGGCGPGGRCKQAGHNTFPGTKEKCARLCAKHEICKSADWDKTSSKCHFNSDPYKRDAQGKIKRWRRGKGGSGLLFPSTAYMTWEKPKGAFDKCGKKKTGWGPNWIKGRTTQDGCNSPDCGGGYHSAPNKETCVAKCKKAPKCTGTDVVGALGGGRVTCYYNKEPYHKYKLNRYSGAATWKKPTSRKAKKKSKKKSGGKWEKTYRGFKGKQCGICVPADGKSTVWKKVVTGEGMKKGSAENGSKSWPSKCAHICRNSPGCDGFFHMPNHGVCYAYGTESTVKGKWKCTPNDLALAGNKGRCSISAASGDGYDKGGRRACSSCRVTRATKAYPRGYSSRQRKWIPRNPNSFPCPNYHCYLRTCAGSCSGTI